MKPITIALVEEHFAFLRATAKNIGIPGITAEVLATHIVSDVMTGMITRSAAPKPRKKKKGKGISEETRRKMSAAAKKRNAERRAAKEAESAAPVPVSTGSVEAPAVNF